MERFQKERILFLKGGRKGDSDIVISAGWDTGTVGTHMWADLRGGRSWDPHVTL